MPHLDEKFRFITTIVTGMDGVVTIDEAQKIVLFNHYAEKMFGYLEKDVIGKPLELLLPTNLAKQHSQYIKKFMDSDEVGRNMAVRQLVHGRHAEGYEFVIEASISQATIESRRYCTAVLRDLTPLRSKQENLEKSQTELIQKLSVHKHELNITSERLTEVQRLSQIGLWELDIKTNVLYWSTEVFEIFELDPSLFEASYDAFLKAIHPEDRKMVNKAYMDSVVTKNPYQIRHRLLMSDGRIKYVEERCETYYEDSGEPIRSVGTIQDVTSQIVTEQQRRRLQNLLLRVETLAETGSWEWNLRSGEIYWSPEIYRQYGLIQDSDYKPDFVIALDYLHPDDRRRIERHVINASNTGLFDPIEYRIVRDKEELRYMRAHGETTKGHLFEPDRMYGFVQDITKYKTAEKEIRETNQLLEAVFDTTHVGIAYLDSNMNFIRVNRAYAQFDNKTPDYFIGKNHFELYPSEENETIFQNAVKTGQPVIVNARPFEYVDNIERGVTHWDWTLTPIKDDKNHVKALLLSVLEVTKRVNAIEALKKNEDKLRTLNDNLEKLVADRTLQLQDERNFIDTVLEIQGALVIVLDNIGSIIRFNRACEDVSGYTFKELKGKPVWDYLIPSGEQEAVKQVFQNLNKSALPSQYENHWRTKNGSQRLIQWSNSILTDKEGIVRYVIATGIDVTERRKTERKLLQSKASLQAAQRIARVGSWERNVDSGEIWWSDENYRIYGKDPEKYQPSEKNFFEFVHPDDMKLVKAACKIFHDEGQADIIHRIILSDGQTRFVHEIMETEYAEDGQPVILRGTVHDITEMKQSEAERNQLQRQLQQAQKMESIGHLTGGIAHDFNNILAAVLGFTQLAISRYAPDREGTLGSYLNEIEKGGKRASELVKQMLAFSRGDTDDHKILDPRPIISDSVNLLRSTIPSSIDIDLKVPKHNVFVQTNALQLQQSVINLIINARDALEGKGKIEIELKIESNSCVECVSCHKVFSGEYISIQVKDNGTGIDREIISRIFEPFFTTKKIGHGSGMGLSLVHGFVHSSGGHVDVNSTTKGTKFTLYYPSRAPIETLTGEDKSGKQEISLINETKEKLILIVDDETAIVRLMSEILSMTNYKVISTNSSREALKLFMASPDQFSLIITDQAMPELTGMELIEEVHAIKLNLPIILCTGYSDIVNDLNYTKLGASKFLTKPIDPDELLKAVSDLLE